MNWDAIGALAELAGAIGVILSLAYLAVQIRQNTRQMEISSRAASGAAYQNILATIQSYLAPVVADAELADIVRRGLVGETLDESESFRFTWLLGGHLSNADNVYYQYRHGVVSEERWQIRLAELRWFIKAPGFVNFWGEWGRESVTPEFSSIIEAEVKAAHDV